MHVSWSRWRAVPAHTGGRSEVAATALWHPVPAVPGAVGAWPPTAPRGLVARWTWTAGAAALCVASALWLSPGLWRPNTPFAVALSTSAPAAATPPPGFPGGPGPAAWARVSTAALRTALAAAEPPAGSPPPTWWSPALAAAAAATGVPVALLGAVAQEESRGNPRAVSPAGAQGLMQLMPGTAAALGVGSVFDARANALGGAEYLAGWLFAYGGRQAGCVSDPAACPQALRLALAAYNAGPGTVAHYGGVPPYPETQRYVAQVTALYLRYRAQE